MKTIKKVTIEPVYTEYIPAILEPGIIYISEEYGTTAHNCLCGCGNKVIMPIDNIIESIDHGWKITKEKDDSVSFTQSVGNYNLDCKSHYVITKNIANFL